MSPAALSALVSYSYLALVVGILLYGLTAKSTDAKPGTPAFSRWMDAYNEKVGRSVAWLIVLTILVSSANAVSRYALNLASNAWLELQWSLFAVAFLFGAAWTLKSNEHVRIDILSSNLPRAARDWIDVFGHLVFLIPLCLVHIYYGVDYFMRSYNANEVSTHAGGLIFWPAKLFLLVGFVLLMLQGVSELLKRFAQMGGRMEHDHEEMSAAEREVKEILETAQGAKH
jgi:TRAP-type mannitol/chloroaromatic compound transport system permease small subunit